MERSRRLWPLAAMLFVIGTSALVRFSNNVRSVDAVGLSGGGFALGVGFAFIVLGLSGRLKL